METPEECYHLVAQEMPEPKFGEYEKAIEVLKDLDTEIVRWARSYAQEHKLPWPPKPEWDYGITVFSL